MLVSWDDGGEVLSTIRQMAEIDSTTVRKEPLVGTASRRKPGNLEYEDMELRDHHARLSNPGSCTPDILLPSQKPPAGEKGLLNNKDL